MTTATKTPLPTHPEQHGAERNRAEHDGAQDNGVAAVDAALARIAEAEAALARITETAAAGGSQTSTVADDVVTSLIRELTVIARLDVRLVRELFGGVAAEFGRVVGLNTNDEQESDLCFGDPTAWV